MKYIRKAEQVEEYVKKLRGPALAIDLEWNSNRRGNVDLVQICSEDLILLVHLAAIGIFQFLSQDSNE